MTIFFFFARRFLLFTIFASLYSISAFTAQAAVIDQISQDFKPLDGYVIKSVGDAYIIDLDQRHGISTGDLFSVLGPGEAITHPVTGKVIGTLDTVKEILKVTRIKKGYSFSKPLGGSAGIKIGDPIRRFENIPSIFWDYTGQGRSFSAQLQSALPHLNWQDYDTAQRTRPEELTPVRDLSNMMYFILTNSGVEVRGPDFLILRKYDLPASLSATGKAPSVAVKVPQSTVSTLAPKIMEPAPEKDVHYAPIFKGSQTIGNLPSVTMMADFIKDDNHVLMAVTNGSEIHIYKVKDKIISVTKADSPTPSQILALKWWQPADKGQIFLAVTAWSNKKVSGILYKFEKEELIPLKKTVPRILGSFDLDEDGKPETLLGQSFDGENFFGSSIKEVKIRNDRNENIKFKRTLPRRFTVVGGQIGDLTGDGKLESAFVRSGILYIHHGKKNIYTSSKEMGGSLSIITYDVDILKKDPMIDSATFELSPVAADIDGDGQLELLAVASDRSSFRIPAVFQDAKKFHLVVFKYRDGRFVKGTLGGKIEGPVQGLAVVDRRVLFVLSQPGSLFGKDGRSHLLSYPLAKK
jgi:hypothetical protein